MTDAPHPLAIQEARKAIACLFVEAPEAVVRDVRAKVEAAFTAYDEALAQARRETWEQAAKMLDEDEVLASPDELDARCKCLCFGILGRLSNKCRQLAEAQP